MRGKNNSPLACPEGTNPIAGFQTQEQHGYGLVNFRYYCIDMAQVAKDRSAGDDAAIEVDEPVGQDGHRLDHAEL